MAMLQYNYIRRGIKPLLFLFNLFKPTKSMKRLAGLDGYMEVSDILTNIIKTNYLHTTINTYYQYDDIDSLFAVGILNKLLYTDSDTRPVHKMRGVDIFKIGKDFNWLKDDASNDNILILINIIPNLDTIADLIKQYKYIICVNKDGRFKEILINKIRSGNIALDAVHFVTHDSASKALVYLLETYYNYYFEPLHYTIVDELAKINSTLADRKEGLSFTYAVQKDVCIGTLSNKWVLNSMALFDHIDTNRFNNLRREGAIIYAYLKSKHTIFRRNAFTVKAGDLNLVVFNNNDFDLFLNSKTYNADILVIYYKNGRNRHNATIGLIKIDDHDICSKLLKSDTEGLFSFDGMNIFFMADKIGIILSHISKTFNSNSTVNNG